MRKLSPNAIKNITPPILSNPIGIDAAITGLQASLTELTWLEKSFGRATVASRNTDNGLYIYPAVLIPAYDNLDMLALDNWKSYSFFVARDNETRVSSTGYDKAFQRPVNLIVWANLQQVDSSKNDDFLEELKQDILDKMSVSPNTGTKVLSIDVTNVYDEPANVFEGFTVELAESQLLYYPYRGLRIEMNVTYVKED